MIPHAPTHVRFLAVALAAAPALLSACSSSSGSSVPATVPPFAAASFTNPTQIDNPYFTLVPGTVHTLVAESADGTETIVVEVLDDTRVVAGVTCVVVRDREFEDGLLVEDTHDWYAQDDAGSVWYMGEDVDNYEYDDEGNPIGVDHEGAWEAGLDVAGIGQIALPGHVMRASPMPGDAYHQEYYPGHAEDFAEVLAVDVPVTLAAGASFLCLQVRETSALDPTAMELKYHAPGIGVVREEEIAGTGEVELLGVFEPGPDAVPDFDAATFTSPTTVDHPLVGLQPGTAYTFVGEADDEIETIVVEATDDVRVVLGVPCAVVRDRVYLDGLLIEDTHDWYAQDDAGNVWYMGEESVAYEYDDEGRLTETDTSGSWEAGQDVAGTGTIAAPGHLMPAMPAVGMSYHQEFYEDEAEDMAFVARLDASVEMDGVTHDDCLQVLEWNPLEPSALEYKFYVAGLGVVLERALHEEGEVTLKGAFSPGPAAVPDFGAASFSTPTTIDNPYLPLVPGAIATYTGGSEDKPETVVVEVLSSTRVVLGVTCAIVQEQTTIEGLVVEDTYDWYAQDDAGNVWYMGEDTIAYEYDDEGKLIDTDTSGSWEAGMDVAGSGTIAEPGHLAPGAPAVGVSYHQEFYAGEAEDMALVVALDVDVELENGATYAGCLQTLEWDPLEPDSLEHKYYAPGVGLVLEEGLSDDERLELEDDGARR